MFMEQAVQAVYKFPSIINNLILQWHLTERCNCNCLHCYQEKKKKSELNFDILLKIFNQYKNLVEIASPIMSRIQITGGEPLLRKDLFLFIEKLNEYRKNRKLEIVLLSNGILLDEKNIRKLKKLRVDLIQVSLEGLQYKNDLIRGRGSFQKIISSIKLLVKHGLKVAVSFTLTKYNASDVPALIELCEKLKVNCLGIRRAVPLGGGKKYLQKQLLSPLEVKKIYNYIEKKQNELSKRSGLKILRGCEEGIFYQENQNFNINNCGVVTRRILTILSNGDVVPCRRLPIKIGNVLKTELIKIYFTSPILKKLTNLNNFPFICKSCPYFNYCSSGARCVSFAYFKNLFSPDPQCWRIYKKLPSIKKSECLL